MSTHPAHHAPAAKPTIPSLQGLPSVTSDHSGVLSGRKTLSMPGGAGANEEMLSGAELLVAILELAMEKHLLEIYSCFFPLLPLLKHVVPSSSRLCRWIGVAPGGTS